MVSVSVTGLYMPDSTLFSQQRDGDGQTVLSSVHAISITSVQRVLDQRVCSMLVYYSQASLTVPVYACLFLFVITHRSVLNINQ